MQLEEAGILMTVPVKAFILSTEVNPDSYGELLTKLFVAKVCS